MTARKSRFITLVMLWDSFIVGISVAAIVITVYALTLVLALVLGRELFLFALWRWIGSLPLMVLTTGAWSEVEKAAWFWGGVAGIGTLVYMIIRNRFPGRRRSGE